MAKIKTAEEIVLLRESGKRLARVLCALAGEIKPGDLLTSSSIPGHAMKADSNTAPAGTIIGKALTGLEKGKKGMIEIFVMLR